MNAPSNVPPQPPYGSTPYGGGGMMQQHPKLPNVPPNITTEQIQKLLDENRQLILAIVENQSLGKVVDTSAYQSRLQKNLVFLATIADRQPGLRPQSLPPDSAVTSRDSSTPDAGYSTTTPSAQPSSQTDYPTYQGFRAQPPSVSTPSSYSAYPTFGTYPSSSLPSQSIPQSSSMQSQPQVQTPSQQPVINMAARHPHQSMPHYPAMQTQPSPQPQSSEMQPSEHQMGQQPTPSQAQPSYETPVVEIPDEDPNAKYWTKEEHNRFLEALRMYGIKDPKKIADHVQTRTVIQVRSHLQKYLAKLERLKQQHALRQQHSMQQQQLMQQQQQQLYGGTTTTPPSTMTSTPLAGAGLSTSRPQQSMQPQQYLGSTTQRPTTQLGPTSTLPTLPQMTMTHYAANKSAYPTSSPYSVVSAQQTQPSSQPQQQTQPQTYPGSSTASAVTTTSSLAYQTPSQSTPPTSTMMPAGIPFSSTQQQQKQSQPITLSQHPTPTSLSSLQQSLHLAQQQPKRIPQQIPSTATQSLSNPMGTAQPVASDDANKYKEREKLVQQQYHLLQQRQAMLLRQQQQQHGATSSFPSVGGPTMSVPTQQPQQPQQPTTQRTVANVSAASLSSPFGSSVSSVQTDKDKMGGFHPSSPFYPLNKPLSTSMPVTTTPTTTPTPPGSGNPAPTTSSILGALAGRTTMPQNPSASSSNMYNFPM